MSWLELLTGFFIANVLGYGGGPASIPLMYQEIVVHYGWVDDPAFSHILALGNTLPGPIATKIAAFVGYHAGGWIGAVAALAATIVPSAAALILLLRLLQKHRQSMMAILTWKMADSAIQTAGVWQTIGIAAVAYAAMGLRKIHPALVIIAAFVYGALVLSRTLA
jgi:chromate transporter